MPAVGTGNLQAGTVQNTPKNRRFPLSIPKKPKKQPRGNVVLYLVILYIFVTSLTDHDITPAATELLKEVIKLLLY